MKLYRIIIITIIFNLLLVGFAQAELLPNDTFYNQQTYLQKLNFSQVWGQEVGSKDVIIAIIDSGVQIAHPDLHDNIWVNRDEILGDGIDNDNNGYVDDINGWDFVTATADPSPKYSSDCFTAGTCVEEAILHGTFVAGVASAIGNNNLGVTGVSWHTKIMPLRVLNEQGAGSTTDVIDAVNYAVDNGASIINLSFVGDTYDENLEASLQRAYSKNVVIVAAAGNEDVTGHRVNMDLIKMYPVCHKAQNGDSIIIGVAAVDENNHLSRFSNYGSSCVTVAAPGENFWGTLVHDPLVEKLANYYGGGFSGTSLATPIVSGLAALLKSYRPALGNWEIKGLIENNADNIDAFNETFVGMLGNGLINPLKSFQTLNPNFIEAHVVKSQSSNVVYYKAVDGKRYVFPNEITYLSWFNNYDNIITISDGELAALQIGGNVTIKPGTKMIKISSIPNVYAVDKGGILRWIKTEQLAAQLYGSNWAKQVVDISDAFWVNYQVGEPIDEVTDFIPPTVTSAVISIDKDKGLN